MSRTLALPVMTGVLLVGCFNPPNATDTSTEGSTGPGPTTGVDSTDDGSLQTTTTADSSSGGAPDTTATTTSDTTSAEGSSSSGEPLAPDIEVSVGGVTLTSGDPALLPDTVAVGALGPVVTITVENVGEAPLTLSGLTPSGPDVGHFSLDIMGVTPVLEVGASTTFEVRFVPLNGGIKDLLVQIGSNDPDEDPFDLVLSGHTTPNRFRPLSTAGSPSARFNTAMAPTPDGRVLLFGGRDAVNDRLADTWILDVDAETWDPIATMVAPPARDAHEMAYVGNDTVLLFGGNDEQGGGSPGLADAWLFDLVTEQWSPLMAPGPGPRFQHMMVSLGTEALLFGGRSNFTELGDTWLFDGATGTWSNLAPGGMLPLPRLSAAMAYDGNDTVVLYGGFSGNDTQPDALEYTVSTNTWALGSGGGAAGDRAVLEGDFLEAGRMFVFSGKLGFCCDDPDPGTFAYDPVTNSWTDLMPPMEPIPRFNYGMVALRGRNKVIIFGGQLTNTGSEDALDQTFEYVGPRPQ